MIIKEGENIFVASNTKYEGVIHIGHCSKIGSSSDARAVTIGKNLIMGAFSFIEPGAVIGDDCEIDHNCIIYPDTKIGERVKILYGSRIYSNAFIGNDVIINGSISERTIVEDNVRFFGKIAHSHRNHTLDWDIIDEPSPIFKKGSFVGINALIIGGITIGENSYIAAGETVRFNVPDNMVFFKGKLFDKEKFRNFIV